MTLQDYLSKYIKDDMELLIIPEVFDGYNAYYDGSVGSFLRDIGCVWLWSCSDAFFTVSMDEGANYLTVRISDAYDYLDDDVALDYLDDFIKHLTIMCSDEISSDVTLMTALKKFAAEKIADDERVISECMNDLVRDE